MSLVATFDVDAGEPTVDKKRKSSGDRRTRHSIYLGGKVDAKDYDKLVNRWKVTHVLNCTPPKQTNIEAGVPNYFEHKPIKDSQQQRSRTLVYHRIPIYDSPASLPDLRSKHEDAIIDFIARGLCHGNILVHCSRGVSRSTTSVVLYLMAKRKLRYQDALELIRRRRPEAQPIPAFESWLKEREGYYRSRQEDEPQPVVFDRTTTKKTKRRISAPIGAAPPPQQQKPSNKPSIGPGLPPPAPGTAIGPEPPPTIANSGISNSAAIGPELPPAVGETSKPKPLPSIGPELPR